MKTFFYRGFDASGARTRGSIEAHDIKEAREKLARSGLFPESIASAADRPARDGFSVGGQTSLKSATARGELYRAVAALLRAGLPLTNALEVLLDQPGSTRGGMLRDLAFVRDRIRDGATMASALEAAGAKVSRFETAVIESGEKTGRLAEALDQVADYQDDAGKINQTLKTAIIYPAIIIVLSLIIGIGVLGFLVPRLALLFEESNLDLPWITRVVLGAGTWFVPVGLPLLGLTGFIAYSWSRRMASHPEARATTERRLARLPFLRSGFQLLVTARFARTSALLLRNGLTMVDTVMLAGRATGSTWIGAILEEKAENIRHGGSLSRALEETPVLGQTLGSWVKAGEASGDLPGMFHHAAGRYQQLWSAYVQRAVNLIEPALIIAVAIFVLVIALAILLPILSINQQIGR
jgi:general secretion pathway protein F